MSKMDQIIAEIDHLVDEASHLLNTDTINRTSQLLLIYESWYTKGLAVVSQIIPERLEDFKMAYRVERREVISAETYTIHDYLLNLPIQGLSTQQFFTPQTVYKNKVLLQISIIKAAKEMASSRLRDIRAELQGELFDMDVHTARELFEAGHLRSAGMICGVVLEGHLSTVAQRHGIILEQHRRTIGALNKRLSEKNILDHTMSKLISYLGEIRNRCAHKSDRDPTPEEIEDLIAKTERVIKEVF